MGKIPLINNKREVFDPASRGSDEDPFDSCSSPDISSTLNRKLPNPLKIKATAFENTGSNEKRHSSIINDVIEEENEPNHQIDISDEGESIDSSKSGEASEQAWF